jgi:hypothetical protein
MKDKLRARKKKQRRIANWRRTHKLDDMKDNK